MHVIYVRIIESIYQKFVHIFIRMSNVRYFQKRVIMSKNDCVFDWYNSKH